MTTALAASIGRGDMIRHPSAKYDPNFREVVRVERRGDGTVEIEVAVGAMIEKLPPLRPTERVEVER